MKLIKSRTINGITSEFFEDIKNPYCKFYDQYEKIYVRYEYINAENIRLYRSSIIWREYDKKTERGYHKVISKEFIDYLEEQYYINYYLVENGN